MSSRTVTYIRWIDSVMQHAQVGAHELPKPVVMESVGFVVAEGEDYVTLARDIDADSDMRGVLSIPKIAIQDREDREIARTELYTGSPDELVLCRLEHRHHGVIGYGAIPNTINYPMYAETDGTRHAVVPEALMESVLAEIKATREARL